MFVESGDLAVLEGAPRPGSFVGELNERGLAGDHFRVSPWVRMDHGNPGSEHLADAIDRHRQHLGRYAA